MSLALIAGLAVIAVWVVEAVAFLATYKRSPSS
jgi:hypothetical protein